jgi:hypothetical protein
MPEVVFELAFLCDNRRVSDGYILGISREKVKVPTRYPLGITSQENALDPTVHKTLTPLQCHM